MAAGDGDLDRALDVTAFYIAKSTSYLWCAAKNLLRSARVGRSEISPRKKANVCRRFCTPYMSMPVDHRGFERICFRDEERAFAAASRLEGDRQHAFHRTDRAVEASSPTKLKFSNGELSSSSVTAIIPRAIGRSKLGPSFFMSAGARLIVSVRAAVITAVASRS